MKICEQRKPITSYFKLSEYLASEKFVLASESNLSLATGLASWKVSLEPCKDDFSRLYCCYGNLLCHKNKSKCSPMNGKFIVTMIVASSDKQWF